ncbi:hypothetical protein CK227_24380 [Mesorhizobium sp. WSM4308]|nr:hypothetical protein CK232_24980 [Mesorhizobium sp. WSM4304]PBB72822.1 hypothetical protein CK227_24380 [Mesorhizobium sp. WSM4308]
MSVRRQEIGDKARIEGIMLTPKKRGVGASPGNVNPSTQAEHSHCLAVLVWLEISDFPGGIMSVLAFELVYFAGLTSHDLLGGVVSLLACLVLVNVMAKDSPNQ